MRRNSTDTWCGGTRQTREARPPSLAGTWGPLQASEWRRRTYNDGETVTTGTVVKRLSPSKSDADFLACIYWMRRIVRCAETGSVPPASGVMVRAVVSPAGLTTLKTELTDVVLTIATLTIWLVPVARPTTV